MPKRILLTGGTGFVGANLARRLLHQGDEVHLLVRPEHDAWRLPDVRDRLTWHAVDLADGDAVRSLLASLRPEWVFHLAVYGAYSDQVDVQRMLETNVVGTVNLVEASLDVGVEAFVNTGSSSEYGFKQHPPTESTWLEPNSQYAVTKASGTLYCRYAGQSRGAPVRTLRLYSVYGPYEEPRRLVPTLIERGLAGELPPLVNPHVARDYVYVNDVLDAYLLAASRPDQQPGAVYNVGTGVQTSIQEVVAIARRIFDVRAEPVWGSMPDRFWDTSVWVADNGLIRSSLGWSPTYTFEEGFREFADWFRAAPERARAYRDRRQRAR